MLRGTTGFGGQKSTLGIRRESDAPLESMDSVGLSVKI